MEIASKITSKGQVTVPKSVRDALGLAEGDRVVFRIDGSRAILARTRNLLDLAGVVPVPVSKRGVPWNEVRRQTRSVRAQARH